MYITNAFSINMLVQGDIQLRFTRLDDANAVALEMLMAKQRGEAVVNAIGHKDLDTIVRGMFHESYLEEGQRMSISWPMDKDTVHRMIVAQYRGPRLPEGCTELPEDADLEFWLIETIEEVQ
jgi:hypothetical protein